jgi:hypothetical protein
MSTFWQVFTATLTLPLLVFGGGEAYALSHHKQTYTNWIRVKLGINPKTRQRLWAPIVFTLVLVSFDVWFIPHILDLWPH